MKYLLLFTLFILTLLMQLQAQANPLDLLQKDSKQNGWIAYKVPATENTRSMCCWDKQDTSIQINGSVDFEFDSCDLNVKSHGYGTTNKTPITENINVYVKIKNGKAKQMLTVGDSCKIITSGLKISWFNNIKEDNSIAFLKRIATTSKEHIASDALYAMSHHKSDKASKELYSIALKNNKSISENAIFWLGEARHDGVDYLKKLYQELPHGNLRQRINFALSQAKTEEAISMLKFITQNDKDTKQRSDAIFWLSQSDVKGIVPFLLNFIETDHSHQVQEKAIFSLAQVETEQASNALLKLAESHPNKNIRKKALFWLVEVNPQKAKQIVLKILKSKQSKDELENAVFTLSRIDEESGNDEGLFDILFGAYSKSVKKKALFWLAQSDNEETIDRLQALL